MSTTIRADTCLDRLPIALPNGTKPLDFKKAIQLDDGTVKKGRSSFTS